MEEPPTYNSLFGQLRQMKKETANPIDFSKKMCTAATGSVIYFVISFICSSALPLAGLIIGSIYLNECPIQKYIPVWLIGFGVYGLFYALISTFEKTYEFYRKKSDPEYKFNKLVAIKTIIGLFGFAWLIAGSVWVYKIYGTVDYNNEMSPNYCQKDAYLFAFSVLTTIYSIGGFMCCCVCCCLSIYLICGKKGDSNEAK